MSHSKTRICAAALALLCACAVAAGCQPTPEEEVVANRLDGTLEQAITGTPAPEGEYAAPERWEETLELRGWTIRFDVPVEVPEADRRPVLTLENASFDAARCVELTELFFGGPVELRESQYSYDEILEDLQYAQRGYFAGIDEETGEYIYGPYEGQKEDIAELKALLAEAAGQEDTFVPLAASGQEFPFASRFVRASDGRTGYLSCGGSKFSLGWRRYVLAQPERMVLQGESMPGERPHLLENVKITKEEAVAIGDAFLKRLGVEGFALAGAEKARMVGTMVAEVMNEGYQLIYVQSVEGTLPFYYEELTEGRLLNGLLQDTDMMYGRSWLQEYLGLYVTEEDVLFFNWNRLKNTVNTASENAPLLPFEDIQQRVRDMLYLALPVYDAAEAEFGNEGDVRVERVLLTSALQQIPEQGDEVFLVPAWAIVLGMEHELDAGLEPEVLLINALDGNYINRWA